MNDSETPKYLLVALAKFVQNDGGLHRVRNWIFRREKNEIKSYYFAIVTVGLL